MPILPLAQQKAIERAASRTIRIIEASERIQEARLQPERETGPQRVVDTTVRIPHGTLEEFSSTIKYEIQRPPESMGASFAEDEVRVLQSGYPNSCYNQANGWKTHGVGFRLEGSGMTRPKRRYQGKRALEGRAVSILEACLVPARRIVNDTLLSLT